MPAGTDRWTRATVVAKLLLWTDELLPQGAEIRPLLRVGARRAPQKDPRHKARVRDRARHVPSDSRRPAIGGSFESRVRKAVFTGEGKPAYFQPHRETVRTYTDAATLFRWGLTCPHRSVMELPAEYLTALHDLMDGLDPVRSAAHGYRESLLKDGWSETAAELMATHVHNEMISMAFAASRRCHGEGRV